MNSIVNNIKQRLSLRELLAEALEVVAKLTDKIALKKPSVEEEYEAYLKENGSLRVLSSCYGIYNGEWRKTMEICFASS